MFDGVEVEGVLPAYHCRFPSMTSLSGMDVLFPVVSVVVVVVLVAVDLLFLTSVTRPGDTQDSARDAAEKATSEDRNTFILFVDLFYKYYDYFMT
jgi:uncharacterized membrane protein